MIEGENMNQSGLPGKQGLYDPAFEHDACGIGMIAHIKGNPSRDIVEEALRILVRLKHRGGQGADPSTGDGAGILTQIPHRLFEKELRRQGVDLPPAGTCGVAMLLLPGDEALRAACEEAVGKAVESEDFRLLAWRTVPVDDSVLGTGARKTAPFVRQLFVVPNGDVPAGEKLWLERKLYVIRRKAEKAFDALLSGGGGTAYFASFSNRTIVYKGLLLPEHLSVYYRDLADEDYQSAIALVHSRFSTNTFPSWERAHPYRYMCHNGEINTIKGNVNGMRAREMALSETSFAGIETIRPIVDDSGSDSAMFDNVLEFLILSGRSLPHAGMMMIPEPWQKDPFMSDGKRAFYEYHANMMEPWDGPAAVVFTDGERIAASLDRNGLRPSRYYVTTDDRIILSSEVGVVDLPPEAVVRKDRLRPGQMLVVDTREGRIIPDAEIKERIAGERPYRALIAERIVSVADLGGKAEESAAGEESLVNLLRAFGYTREEVEKGIKPLAEKAEDPLGSMGYDAPLAVLSRKPQLLYNYFKQMFAQVTNPPIDASLEEMITSSISMLGPEFPLLSEPGGVRRIRLETPVLTNGQMASVIRSATDGIRVRVLPMLFRAEDGPAGLQSGLDNLLAAADRALDEGATVLVLSDRGVSREWAPIPALLAVSGLHHHLIRTGRRTAAGIAVETGEARETHHVATLLGYGANAVNPWLLLDTVAEAARRGELEQPGMSPEEAVARAVKALTKGLMKILSKMGISTIQSYIGAQIFEAVGIHADVIDAWFPGTPSRLGGIRLADIADETLARHQNGFGKDAEALLPSGDDFQWRKDGEEHLFNPSTIHLLQYAVREGNYDLYKRYSKLLQEEMGSGVTLRGNLAIDESRTPVPLEEVEPVESILKRFKSGAMSYGSISQEAHEALAIAMNRIGGKSNSGEGGEDPGRFVRDPNGDWRNSAIKQVASGRFGVSAHYLLNAEEIQIKMAQGAKPGEGGQLPGHKVYPWIARARGSTPGVDLISPPPHHDIYSIEDLAELIYDLKNINPRARINVKLVSEAGVGTIAAGVAKAGADVILISGYDGGTGAAARSSIKHAGMPWEIGLAETHQTLLLNGLRDRVVLEADGKMMTGRDVLVAAMLGAEEFGFATAPLVALGCVMMRVCHMDTCPVGIATQNPELRAKFPGKPEHVVNFMTFIAMEVREWLARLGFRSLDEAVGRTDLLRFERKAESGKTAGLDLTALLERVPGSESWKAKSVAELHLSDRGLDDTLDIRDIIPAVRESLETGVPIEAEFAITNKDRAAGTLLGHEVTKRYGAEGLPADTIRLKLAGSAGQSFGAFLPRGVTLLLEGDANDYVGKGLSGGTIAVRPPKESKFAAEDNIIIGNTAFYGATDGEAYIRGEAGERFCVRNSGARVVVEGVGNHGCEYMTGGRVVILGRIGLNFAAGMSGGIAYVLADSPEDIKRRCNNERLQYEHLQDSEDEPIVRAMIERHALLTDSPVARRLLADWPNTVRRLIRIAPIDYLRIVSLIDRNRKAGVPKEEAELAAFLEKKRA
jgi:glutamate synthase (ferredoxin)